MHMHGGGDDDALSGSQYVAHRSKRGRSLTLRILRPTWIHHAIQNLAQQGLAFMSTMITLMNNVDLWCGRNTW